MGRMCTLPSARACSGSVAVRRSGSGVLRGRARSGAMNHSGTVLVAEDDRDQREILCEVLEYEGFKVVTAASSKQLIERLSPEIDLLLLDVNGVHSPEVDVALARLGRD